MASFGGPKLASWIGTFIPGPNALPQTPHLQQCQQPRTATMPPKSCVFFPSLRGMRDGHDFRGSVTGFDYVAKCEFDYKLRDASPTGNESFGSRAKEKFRDKCIREIWGPQHCTCAELCNVALCPCLNDWFKNIVFFQWGIQETKFNLKLRLQFFFNYAQNQLPWLMWMIELPWPNLENPGLPPQTPPPILSPRL